MVDDRYRVVFADDIPFQQRSMFLAVTVVKNNSSICYVNNHCG